MKDQKPNVLLIIVDQLTAALTGAYGHAVVRTPNLDRLVSGGIRFDAAYSPCPVCAPARGALMSGRYVSNCKAYDNAAPWPEDMVTIPHYLTLAGYDTALSGKMHFVGADQLHGFHRRFVTNIYPADFKWTPARQDPFNLAEGEQPEFRPTGGQAHQYVGGAIHVGRWSSTLSFDEETHFRALEYLHAKGTQRHRTAFVAAREFEDLDTMRGREPSAGPPAAGALASPDAVPQPFFLCVSYHHPHEPFWPPQEYWDMYGDKPIDVPAHPENLEATYSTQDRWLNDYHGCADHDLTDPESAARVRRAYYGLVTYIDDKVGELMASLEENGLADSTVVVFCSDHGDMLCEKGMVQKRCFYEWSAQVPLIVRLPQAEPSGVVVETGDQFPESLMSEPSAFSEERFSELMAQLEPKIGFTNCVCGNYIIIDHENGEFSFYAHLSEGALRVKPGDRVAQGDVIAAVGNTGHTSEPHLHFHLMDSKDFLTANGLPVTFKNVPPTTINQFCKEANSLSATDYIFLRIAK